MDAVMGISHHLHVGLINHLRTIYKRILVSDLLFASIRSLSDAPTRIPGSRLSNLNLGIQTTDHWQVLEMLSHSIQSLPVP